jgi:hypothetical protein
MISPECKEELRKTIPTHTQQKSTVTGISPRTDILTARIVLMLEDYFKVEELSDVKFVQLCELIGTMIQKELFSVPQRKSYKTTGSARGNHENHIYGVFPAEEKAIDSRK